LYRMAFTEQTSAQDRQTKQSGFRIRRLRVSRVSIASLYTTTLPYDKLKVIDKDYRSL